MRPASDGGYIIGGWSDRVTGGDRSQPGRGVDDYWVLKLDAQGRKQWDRTLGGEALDYLKDVQQTSDGGYLVGGYSSSGQTGDKTEPNRGSNLYDYWIVKLDAQGNKEWDRTLGGTEVDYLASLQQTTDGGYIVAGNSSSPISGDKTQFTDEKTDYWIIKLDAQGHRQWDRVIRGNSLDRLAVIRQTPDGGYVVGGTSDSAAGYDKTEPSRGQEDYWVVKLDNIGRKQWDRTFGGQGSELLVALQLTPDGGYILGGNSTSSISGEKSGPSRGGIDYWIVKLDATGSKQWDQTIGGDKYESLTDVQLSPDGGYLLGGYTNSGISGEKSEPQIGANDIWAVKLTATGTRQWDYTFGADKAEAMGSILPTTDGSCIIGGQSESPSLIANGGPGSFGPDLWIFKFKAAGIAPPTVKITGDSLLCAGGQLPLTAAAPVGTTYKWSTGATSATIIATYAGTYQVTATFSNGQTSTAQRRVTAFSPTASIQGDTLLCASQTLQLKAAGDAVTTYRWSTGATTAGITIAEPGTYSLTTTYPTGCSRYATIRVRLASPAPRFTLGADTTICEGNTLVLRAPPLMSQLSYRWSDGSTSSSLVVSTPGTYTLVITTPCAKQTFTRRVDYTSCVFLPTIVTANGDGRNDYFTPTGLPGPAWALTIYNRWGRQVYSTQAYHNEWGAGVAPGIYYYVLQQAATGRQYKGTIEVMQ